jgi:copper chaperone NosL
MKLLYGLLGLTIFLVTSCTIEPSEIVYGKDGCSYCKMTIVDKLHGAEVVTAKGKVYKYDAIECMINDLANYKADELGLLLVIDYGNPGVLVSAEFATYLVSENVPSPMGAFLSGFSTAADAEKVHGAQGGDLFNWPTVKKKKF